jgi:threonine/homoserine/homoserine lactone efflux protein
MPDAQHLLLFVAAGLLLNLTPGPDVLYIVTNALRCGARAGVVAGLTFVLLGTLFNVNSIAVNSGWALAAAWMARQLSAAARRRAAPEAGEAPRGAATPTQWGGVGAIFPWLDRAAGAMFIAFGVKLALSDNPSR